MAGRSDAQTKTMLLSSGIIYRHSAYTAPSSSFLLPLTAVLDVYLLARSQAKIVSLVGSIGHICGVSLGWY